MVDTTKSRLDEGTRVLDPLLKAELKRLAILFLLSSVTLVLVLAYAAARGIDQQLIPAIAWIMWATAIVSGSVATYFYGLYVTVRARAWGWVALCAIPVVGSVPACVAYAWIRRGKLERQIIGDELS